MDPPERSAEITRAYGLGFALLSDPGADTIDAYGVRHRGAGLDGEAIARPATFVIDRRGQVVWRDLTDNWRVRVRPDRIVERLREIP